MSISRFGLAGRQFRLTKTIGVDIELGGGIDNGHNSPMEDEGT
jgi:hypothetical protein